MKVLVTLVLIAGLGAGTGAAVWTTEQLPDASAVEPPSHRAATPLLSVRRTPEALLRPRRDAAVAAAAATIPDRVPGDSCLVVTEQGRPLFEHAPAVPLVPASTQKLLVGATVFELLDPDARFQTTVWAEAIPLDGVVAGDVWLVGGGDPLLATEDFLARDGDLPRPRTRFEDLADELVAAGIRSIEGSIVGDGTRYDDLYSVPSWPARYREQVSAGPLAGLTVNDGLETFTPERVPINPGRPAADPPAHAAAVLDDLLEARGVAIGGAPRSGAVPAGAVQIATLRSLPVHEVVAEMMQWSNNTSAELLLKEIAVRGGAEGTTAAGGSIMVARLAGMGVDVSGVAPVDGSGLDLENQVTCRALGEVLDIAGPDSVLADTLAVAGVSGTLRNRVADTPASGRVRAKTGSLRHVATLAGFVDAANGRTYTFAIMANLPDGEFMPGAAFDLQDELMVALAALPELQVPAELEPLAPVGSATQ